MRDSDSQTFSAAAIRNTNVRLLLSLIFSLAVCSCSTMGPTSGKSQCTDGSLRSDTPGMHWDKFEVRTAKNFIVQGEASGRFLVTDSVVCFAVDGVSLSMNETSSKPMRVASVRLGIGQQSRDDSEWSLLGTSAPHAVNAEVPLKGTLPLGPFETHMTRPANLVVPGAYAVMEIVLSIPGESREAKEGRPRPRRS